MKREYEEPNFSITKLTVSDDLLNASRENGYIGEEDIFGDDNSDKEKVQ